MPYSLTYGQPSFGALCGVPTFPHYPGQSGFPHLSTFFPAGHIAGSRSGNLSAQKKRLTMDASVQVSGNLTNETRKDSKVESYDESESKSKQFENVETQRRNMSFTRRQPQRQQRGNPNQRRGRSRGRNMNTNRNQNVLKFDSDYDFEQANAEFLELENKLSRTKIDDTESETPDAVPSDTESFYDRKKSFFDSISCEGSQMNARYDWRQERKLNVETFGVPRSNTWVRGRRRRGGFRTRGGFRSRQMNKTGGTATKTVKFEDEVDEKPVETTVDDIVETAVKETELQATESSEIPTIELVAEKDAWLDDPSSEEKSKNDWK